jgi:PAS domain S-box-containing protein
MTAQVLAFSSVVLYLLSVARVLALLRLPRARRAIALFAVALSVMAGERVVHLLPLSAGVPESLGFAATEFLAATFLFLAVMLFPVALRSMLESGAPEERVRFLLESGDDAVLILDASATRIRAANHQAAHRVSRSREQLVGLTPLELGPEMTSAWLEDLLEPLRQGRVPWVRAETQFRGRDGSTWPVGLHVQWGTYAAEEVLVMAAVDVTGRKAADEALRASRARLEDAQRVAHLGTWEWDLVEDRIIWSDELYRIFGVESGSFAPSLPGILEVMHPEDRTRMQSLVTQARAHGTDFEGEYRVVPPDGEVRWIHVKGRTERDPAGSPVRIVGVSQDITQLRQAEESASTSAVRYRRLFEQAPVSLWEEDVSEVIAYLDDLKREGVTDLAAHLDAHPEALAEAAGRVVVMDVNPATVEMYGADSRDDFLGPFSPDPNPESLRALRATLIALFEGRPHLQVTTRETRADGTPRDLVVSMNLPVSPADGGVALVSLVDISERVAATEALRAREAELSAALDAARMGVWHWDMRSGEVVWSREAYGIFGSYGERFDGTVDGYMSLILPEDLPSIQADIQDAIEGTGDYSTEVRLKPDAEGKIRWMAGAGRIAFDEDHVPLALHGLVWDITEQRSAEQALRETEARLASVVDHAPVVLFAFDVEGRVTLSEGRHPLPLGLESDQLVGRSAYEVFADSPSFIENLRRAMEGNEVVSTVPLGASVFDARFSPVRDRADRITGVIGIATDITGIVQAEAEQAKLVSLVEGTQDFIALATLDGSPSYVNPAGLSLVGVEGLDRFRRFTLPDFMARPELFDDEVLPALHSYGHWRSEIDVKRLDTGEIIPCFGNVFVIQEPTSENPLAVAVLLRDLREEREALLERDRMERQLRQAQKMETIGTLAGGIAHDFNNLLTPILGYAHMMQEEMGVGGPFHEDVEEIVQAASRAKDLVRQILSFSRQKEQDFRAVDVAPVLREATRLLRATLPSAIEVRIRIEEGCGWVRGDPTQLHQVVLNLATNALHAMREQNGVLGIDLAEVEIDEVFCLAHPGLSVGPHVRLTVSDTGHGMPADVLERVLEPFFTTKESGEGTGLGLSVVHGIVTAHQGAISLYSEEGVGTTVNLYLPVADRGAGQAVAGQDEVQPQRRQRVLVVDDRPDIASLVKRMLQSMGHDAETAFGSAEALARIQAQPDYFDVMITDYSMPEMSGLELIRAARELRSGLPVVLASGFSESLTPERLAEEGIGAFLMKPFVARELARALERALGRGR